MNWVIYTLKHPRTNEVRYVGWTVTKPETRLRNHVMESVKKQTTHKHRWVLSLVSIGLMPLIEVIETGTGPGWKSAEKRWIALYRGSGARLTNGTDGGDGCPGRGTPEQRSAIAKKANASQTPEQRSARAKKAQTGYSPEQRTSWLKTILASKTPEQVTDHMNAMRALREPGQPAAIIREVNARRTFEQRSVASRKAMAGKTAEERSESSRKAVAKWLASSTAEQRSAAIKKGHASKTSEQRSEHARNAANAQWAAKRHAAPPSGAA